MVRGVQHDQPVLEVDVLSPMGVMSGDGKELALAQRLTEAHVDQDQEPLQKLVDDGLIPFNRLLAPDLGVICSDIQKRIP